MLSPLIYPGTIINRDLIQFHLSGVVLAVLCLRPLLILTLAINMGLLVAANKDETGIGLVATTTHHLKDMEVVMGTIVAVV